METNVQSALRKSGDIQRKFAVQSQNSGDKLGKSDFLNLFMTQLSNQDPLDPMDSSKMMQQVSQMGTMEQLQLMNEKLDGMDRNQKEMLTHNSINYLNRDVSYAENSLRLRDGAAESFSYFIPDQAKSLKVSFIDQEGKIVAEQSMSNVPAGERQISWDGKNSKGEKSPDGEYRLRFLATGENGARMDVDLNKVSRVSKIKFDEGRPKLLVDGEYRDAAEVKLMESRPTFAEADPLLVRMEPYRRTAEGATAAGKEMDPKLNESAKRGDRKI